MRSTITPPAKLAERHPFRPTHPLGEIIFNFHREIERYRTTNSDKHPIENSLTNNLSNSLPNRYIYTLIATCRMYLGSLDTGISPR